MCEIIEQAARQSLTQSVSRRGLLAGMGGVVAGGLLASQTLPAQAAPGDDRGPLGDTRRYRSKLVLLGTAGGPIWYPGTDRMGISSAVVVGDAVYLIDFGDGAGHRFKQAALVPEELQTVGGNWGEEKVRAFFITHLHSDHIADYFHHFILGWSNGLRRRAAGMPKIQVYGPGRRTDEQGNNVLPPIWAPPGQPTPDIPVNNPENPVPGIVDTTNYLFQAFSLDINDRMRDGRNPSLWTYYDVHDIPIPTGYGYHPNTNHEPAIPPWLVYEDDRVRVTATLVDHFPIVPAFGFRFDSDDGSVVFSGDTAPSPNLIRLAQDADVLVHEVITEQWVQSLFPQPWTENNLAQMNHLLTAHTLPEDCGKVAEQANVKTLVLSHIVPGNAPNHHLRVAKKHFRGRLIIGQDLQRIGIGRRAS
jgi:ribonuclease BN (tRNA processing enzyme)